MRARQQTAGQPTEYGSSIYEGYQPRADAAVVAQLRAAGAVAIGKTVTTEFAVVHPGPTTQPASCHALIGRHDEDASLLAVAAWLAHALPKPDEPALPSGPPPTLGARW